MNKIILSILIFFCMTGITIAQFSGSSSGFSDTITCEERWKDNHNNKAACYAVDSRISIKQFQDFLIEHDIDVNKSVDTDGWSVAHYVLLSQNLDKIKIVDLYNANWEKATLDDFAPIVISAIAKSPDAFMFILNKINKIPEEYINHLTFIASKHNLRWLLDILADYTLESKNII